MVYNIFCKLFVNSILWFSIPFSIILQLRTKIEYNEKSVYFNAKFTIGTGCICV